MQALHKIRQKPLSSYLLADETRCVEDLLKALNWDANRADNVAAVAEGFVREVRKAKRPPMQLESFLQQYSLDTEEGLALMCLAEALLRIPDKETASALIHDKMTAADWLGRMGSSKDWVVKAAGVGLVMTSHTLDSALSRIGEPFIREAMVKAMHMMGKQFVLGTDIKDAYKQAAIYHAKGYRMSYDMLGEGARTAEDAEAYFKAYKKSIAYIAEHDLTDGVMPAGVSVKLSALYPRYEFAQKEQCIPALSEKLRVLCQMAAAQKIPLTVDAEEVARLDISLAIIEEVLSDRDLEVWDGFGLAVQAYQKRAFVLIDRLATMARIHGRRIQVRLVKGAYWDSEIKRAQELGLKEYPVFTRKCHSDLSYLACAAKLFYHSDVIYPMFATHNAHSIAAVLELARDTGVTDFEFQRLHGMGEALYDVVLAGDDESLKASIYAPVGSHEALLPYLVRRLLENGANSSFVNKLLDKSVPARELVADPVERSREGGKVKRHKNIPLPSELYRGEEPYGRRNSIGVDFDDGDSVVAMMRNMAQYQSPYDVTPLIGGKIYKETAVEELSNPSDSQDNLGMYWPANKAMVKKAMRVAGKGFVHWRESSAETRAQALEDYARLLEENTPELIVLLNREAGKTIPDALSEIREAVDFCRYYANRGRKDFKRRGHVMPGVTGESNVLRLRGRGVFVCISPWNFPLAIFTGQIVAALMAGNSVVAKPASQTPLIAYRAVQLMHEAGIPTDVLNFMPCSGAIGAEMVAHGATAGVVFTGSTEVAREINQVLAAKDGPIVPFIAETGGMNTMIVDSSALVEQVVDDVIISAFGSAGQRCSALRILCVQEDIAEDVIDMLSGAMVELKLGVPGDLASDIGPVIDEGSRGALVKHRNNLKGFGKLIGEAPLDVKLKKRGHYFAPVAFELPDLAGLDREVFGPILHVVRYKRDELGGLIDEINSKGYGLTMGVHSRIERFSMDVAKRVRSGNAYINRSMIGAVVGSQPFGGQGLSGTGPKAGGPHYLPRFATEEVISIDTTASGGNASLVSLEE